MQRYLLFRIGQSILALWGVSIIVFSLARLSGDMVNLMLPMEATGEDFERVRKAWGLDKPQWQQYLIYMGNIFQGDWGDSWRWGTGALDIVLEKFPNTVEMATVTLLFSTIFGLGLGVLVATKKDTVFDIGGKVIALMGQSLPSFWTGIVLMWIFAVLLGWLPTSGKGVRPFDVKYMIMPAITLGWFNVAALMRLTRSAMLEVLDSEYVKLARIKGLPEWKVIWKHCLRNAAIAPLTYFGVIAGYLLTGAVVVETVFAWPGIGLLAVEAIQARDYMVVQAVVIFMASIFILSNLVVDVLYAYLDPRIRYN
jgi:peptide/nickel transport system permease protein